MAMAVVFAMLTSYLLSRTLVPTMVHYLLAGEVQMYGGVDDPDDPHQHPGVPGRPRPAQRSDWAGPGDTAALVAAVRRGAWRGGRRRRPAGSSPKAAVKSAVGLPVKSTGCAVLIVAGGRSAALILVARFNLIWRTHEAFNRQFEKFRRLYGGFLVAGPGARGVVVVGVRACSCWPPALLLPFIGRDFFPQVDAGQIRLHVRCPSGTRVEETERYFARVEEDIRARHSRATR